MPHIANAQSKRSRIINLVKIIKAEENHKSGKLSQFTDLSRKLIIFDR